MECDLCNKSIKIPGNNYFTVYINHTYQDGNISQELISCSIDCLLEWAWKIKEDQEKLSKSKGYK
jgi:hypothetical protein